MEASCLFCRIAAGEIPVCRVYEDENAVAFLDIAPRAPGHTLVIPRAHVADLVNLPESAVGPLFITVRKVAARLRQALGTDDLTVGINQGEVGGQVVPHLHVHLLPRFRNDGGGSVQSVVNNPPPEALAEIQQKIINSKE